MQQTDYNLCASYIMRYVENSCASVGVDMGSNHNITGLAYESSWRVYQTS